MAYEMPEYVVPTSMLSTSAFLEPLYGGREDFGMVATENDENPRPGRAPNGSEVRAGLRGETGDPKRVAAVVCA